MDQSFEERIKGFSVANIRKSQTSSIYEDDNEYIGMTEKKEDFVSREASAVLVVHG